jgi:hypothetical protein
MMDTFATYGEEESSDFFNEAEGAYTIEMANDGKLAFDIHGMTYERYSPVFKIRNYRSFDDPQTVYRDGALLDKGADYNAAVIPFSEAWYFGTNPNWWNGSWGKRAPVTITYSGTPLTDYYYQVKVDVTYDADMQPDFDDIRFIDSDHTTELDYYRESDYTASSSAVFWVEVPSIPNGGKTIYMYYDNAGVSTTSSGPNTFEYFDDFESYTTGDVNGQNAWTSPVGSDPRNGEIKNTNAFSGTQQLEHYYPSTYDAVSSEKVVNLGTDRLINARICLIAPVPAIPGLS